MRIVPVLSIFLAIMLSYTQARAYYPYQQLFSGYNPYFRAPPIRTAQLQSTGIQSFRDPRTNTGPVLFPPGPPGNPVETSGVIVGASGYGFVPPNAGKPIGPSR